MKLSTVVVLSLLLAVGIILAALALEEPVKSRATWRAPVLKSVTPTPTPEGGWWETIPTLFIHATRNAVSQPTWEARP